MRLGITQTSCNSLVIIKNNLKQPENNQKISSKNAITFIISRTVRRIVSTDDFVFKTLGEKRTTPYFLLFKSSLEQNKEKTDKNKKLRYFAYRSLFSYGAPGRIRTGDREFRRLVLCPAELPAHMRPFISRK